jgi:hypothetical protein
MLVSSVNQLFHPESVPFGLIGHIRIWYILFSLALTYSVRPRNFEYTNNYSILPSVITIYYRNNHITLYIRYIYLYQLHSIASCTVRTRSLPSILVLYDQFAQSQHLDGPFLNDLFGLTFSCFDVIYVTLAWDPRRQRWSKFLII